MRLALRSALVLSLLNGAALAEPILARADIGSATVYATQATLTRRAVVTLPGPGLHLVRLALPGAGGMDLPQVAASAGARIGAVTLERGLPLAEGALDTPAQAAARTTRDAARDALQTLEDEIALADALVRAANLQVTHLDALAEGEGLPGEAPLGDRLANLAAQMRRALSEVQDARIALRALEGRHQAARDALTAAEFALAALAPFGDRVDALAIEVTTAAAGDVTLTLTHASDGVSWQPAYDLRLDSTTGALDVARFIRLDVPQGQVWRDVDVTFSTADPLRARDPALPFPDPARIVEQSRPMPLSRQAEMAPALMLDAAPRAGIVTSGLAISYAYGAPVTLGASGSAVLPFDPLAFRADLRQVAAPRLNATAYLVADLVNDSGAPILPGAARFFRDGALIGEGFLDLIPAGAEAELAFGPLDHLALGWSDLSLDEGDRGLFTPLDTQERRLRFEIRNLSPIPQEVQVLYALPFAEQEDLDLTVTLSEDPDSRDWDDRRGVAEWRMALGAGETRSVEMRVEFDWPEGQALLWQP